MYTVLHLELMSSRPRRYLELPSIGLVFDPLEMDLYPSSQSESQTAIGVPSGMGNLHSASSQFGDRLANTHPSPVFPAFGDCPVIPPTEIGKLTEIIHKLATNYISRRGDRHCIHSNESTVRNTDGGRPLPLLAPSQHSDGQGALKQVKTSQTGRKFTREHLNSIIGYETAYYDLLKSIPASEPKSALPSGVDPITRWAYLKTMIEHYIALDLSYLNQSSRLASERFATRKVLRCLWDVIQNEDKNALNRLHVLLMTN